jgi:hypothetical protein
MPETELLIATTTDPQAIAQAVADGDEKGGRVPASKPDSADSVSFEHPRSERTMLLERLKAHESDLEALSSSDADLAQVSSNESEAASEETEPQDIDLATVRRVATEDAIAAARQMYQNQQHNAHFAPTPAQIEAEAEAIRAQARPAFQKRFAELTKGIDVKTLTVDVPIYKSVEDALLTLPGGPEATLFLARNPQEVSKLQGVPEHLALAHVAQLTARLSHDFNRRPTSKAPAPIRPLSGSSTKSSVPPDEMPYQEYRRMRDAQEKNRYKR